MQQLISLWNALDTRRRAIVAVSTFAVIALILLLARTANNPSMALLYAGLEPAVSGEVVAALEQRGVAFSVKGDAIFVEASKRDVTRMELAGQGMPASGVAGYELLDDLTGFGTTAQMFDAAYWRAKEGELARTILAWPQIKSARVHIANPVQRVFSTASAATASVTLKMSAGVLTQDRARALRFLVASAVPGLSPESVSIIDTDRGLVSSAGENILTGGGDQRAEILRNNVQRLLEARVGSGNAMVEVAMDIKRDQETVIERRFDPDSRVAISTDTQEISESSSDTGGSQVTVASNLPTGDGADDGSSSRNSNSETRERINYEVSETTRETIRNPGIINRLTVAVLVNSIANDTADGIIVWTARSEEELLDLQKLVESTVGFDENRGDVVTIKTMEFQALPANGTLATASVFSGILVNAAGILQSGLLAIVILGLGLFVVKPVLATQAVSALPSPVQNQNEAVLTGQAVLPQIETTDKQNNDGPDPIAQLRQIISERQDDSIEVLKNWIETSEEQTG